MIMEFNEKRQELRKKVLMFAEALFSISAYELLSGEEILKIADEK